MDEQDITPTQSPTQSPTQAPAQPNIDFPEDGAVFGNEKVVHDTDEQGNVVGWHKETI